MDQQPGTSGQSRAMTELANLVNAHPRSAGPLRMQAAPEVLDMRPVIQRIASRRGHESAGAAAAAMHDETGLSGDNESLSSRVSDKNLADFEDENSVDEEMLQLAQTNHILQQQQQLANMALYHQRLTAPRLTARQQREEARLLGKKS